MPLAHACLTSDLTMRFLLCKQGLCGLPSVTRTLEQFSIETRTDSGPGGTWREAHSDDKGKHVGCEKEGSDGSANNGRRRKCWVRHQFPTHLNAHRVCACSACLQRQVPAKNSAFCCYSAFCVLFVRYSAYCRKRVLFCYSAFVLLQRDKQRLFCYKVEPLTGCPLGSLS